MGWIDEHVLLIQGKEDHLEVLREGWTRRALKPPRGFEIKCIGKPEPMASQGDPCWKEAAKLFFEELCAREIF